MAGAHPVSAVVVEVAREEGLIIWTGCSPCLRLALQLLLDPVPDLNVHDPRMKAVMGLPFVAQPSDIDRVRQDPVQMATRDQYAAGRPATSAHPGGGANVLGVESILEAHHAAEFEVAAIEGPDELSLAFNDVEGAAFDPVAERDRSAHPDALPFRRGDLIPDSLAGDF